MAAKRARRNGKVVRGVFPGAFTAILSDPEGVRPVRMQGPCMPAIKNLLGDDARADRIFRIHERTYAVWKEPRAWQRLLVRSVENDPRRCQDMSEHDVTFGLDYAKRFLR